MQNKKGRLVYSVQDIKDILGIGNTTIHELLIRETNPIPHFRIGRRIVIPCDLFEEWLNNQAARNQKEE